MSRLDVAMQRFSAALDTLEARIKLHLETATPGSDETLAQMRAERNELLARVAELEEDRSAISGLAEEVEGRLDGAIAEIRAVLGRN